MDFFQWWLELKYISIVHFCFKYLNFLSFHQVLASMQSIQIFNFSFLFLHPDRYKMSVSLNLDSHVIFFWKFSSLQKGIQKLNFHKPAIIIKYLFIGRQPAELP